MPSKKNTSKKSLVKSSVGSMKSMDKNVKKGGMVADNTEEDKWWELTIPEKRRLGTWR